MRIASWNINSVRNREQRVRDFLERSDVDVLCLQETKCTDDQFPDFSDTGYQHAHVGENAWNGVAILSRVGLEDVRSDFGQPRFHKDPLAEPVLEPRAVGARCGGVEVWSLYVPNGREISDRHFTYKIDFLDAMASYLEHGTEHGGGNSGDPVVVVGDFNVIPTDEDLWDRSWFEGKTHVTPRERAALDALVRRGGVTEATAPLRGTYTYWDYQAMRFQRNQGIRIDLQYARGLTPSAPRVDRDERSGKGASDHAPVIVDYTL
ncbi:exodeoxyribonuclease III [Corynebacteriaceae bacterium 7-707]